MRRAKSEQCVAAVRRPFSKLKAEVAEQLTKFAWAITISYQSEPEFGSKSGRPALVSFSTL